MNTPARSSRSSLPPSILGIAVVIAAALLGPSPAPTSAQRTGIAPTATPVGPRFCGLTSDGGVVRLQLNHARTLVESMEIYTVNDVGMSTKERCATGAVSISQEEDTRGQFIFRCDLSNYTCRPSREIRSWEVTPTPPPPTATPMRGQPGSEPRPTSAKPEPPPPVIPPAPRPQPSPQPPRDPEPPEPGGPLCGGEPCFSPIDTPTPRSTPFGTPRPGPTEAPVCRTTEIQDVLIVGKLLMPDYAEGRYDFLVQKYPRNNQQQHGFNLERVKGTWQAWHPALAPCP